MRRVNYTPYFFLVFCLFLFFSLPLRLTESVRSKTVNALHLSWLSLTTTPKEGNQELEQLKLENLKLRTQIQSIREWLLYEERIEDQLERFKEISKQSGDFFHRRSIYLSQFLDKQFQSIPAQVIFREPNSWSSTLWVNVGEKDNELLEEKIIVKNSPVLMGFSVIGLVEYVGQTQSKVRLITDTSLNPSVRAIRGNQQNRLMREHIDALVLALSVREGNQEIIPLLQNLKSQINEKITDRYLAKGELRGSAYPLWRARGQHLKGIGFNYDYADEEGQPHELRSPDSILQPGDLLVTSGLDGVFPPDIPIAVVTNIHQLREGACSYDLEARTLCGNLDDITSVFILPPFNNLPGN